MLCPFLALHFQRSADQLERMQEGDQSAGLGARRGPRLAGVEAGGLLSLVGPMPPPACEPACHLHHLVFQPALKGGARPPCFVDEEPGWTGSVIPKRTQHDPRQSDPKPSQPCWRQTSAYGAGAALSGWGSFTGAGGDVGGDAGDHRAGVPEPDLGPQVGGGPAWALGPLQPPTRAP